jgi:cysteine desulfurase
MIIKRLDQMGTNPIYLDYMATTPVDVRVCEVMMAALRDLPGNAASESHVYGWRAQQAVAKACEQVASLISGDKRGVVWTSGATESINLALQGAAKQYMRKGRHIITTEIEHAAALQCCHALVREGFDVTYLKPDIDGLVSAEQVAAALRSDTILVSIMHANNEIGVVQPIADIAQVLRGKGVVFHVDAAQTLGKIPVDVEALGVDLLSASAHKCYGPKGIGLLYVRQQPRIRLVPLIHGGGQQNGLRSGTLATHQIVGFGEACAIAQEVMDTEAKRLLRFREELWNMLSGLACVRMTGHRLHRLPGNVHFSVEGLDAEVLLKSMPEFAMSTGSACRQEAAEPSHVLRALGFTPVQAQSAVRLCFGRYTTEQDFIKLQQLLLKVLSEK